ncbi:ATPase subunit of ABC transporter with duplicated ATPase domains [Paenochrobactrum gallinarii]|uniref:ATPase subunit of ABC transporter with duplicated ATPase domains n=1 Tax=Paenochrobactrum gallinarii TaxID=643673 RepID=A0A841M503_9HYPH|nr:ABC-F family ATP-binding cassette domain-containing protein [Paenochrobactrum gallinarii]MBB6261371.1 ATPase subunit of ABC transporter with duplicated ATPase domains [Paenochrobactrum gallinarii]
MTHHYLTLEGVSYVLPDGTTLFHDLNEQFDHRPTGMVGRNGAGKTVLARILSGALQPTTGHCQRSGAVHYLAQQIAQPDNATLAGLAGMQSTLDALKRIEAGSTEIADFDALGDRWDIEQQLQTELERNGLGHLDAMTPANRLSGGEAMRVTLIGALLSNTDFLILDEPTNHLDRPNRIALIEQLKRWPRGLLVISHDRQLLDAMERIVELSSLGLRSYGGNYSFYEQSKQQEREGAIKQLDHLKAERRREEQNLRDQREKLEKRQASGNRTAKQANQAKILLGRQKNRSEGSAGKLQQQQSAARELLSQRVFEAEQQLEENTEIALHQLPVSNISHKRIAELDNVELPFVSGATRFVSISLTGQQRLGLVGPNGYGKSTLLKILSGQLQPLSGTCKMFTEGVYLDQQLSNLDPEQTVLEQIRLANPVMPEGDLRMRLAQLGLDLSKITVASGTLSGGEGLKAALACVLYADPPAQLLMLDEPSNHLDLPSLNALEAMLRSYQGALVVVSHDDRFMDNIGLTNRLIATNQGWQFEQV